MEVLVFYGDHCDLCLKSQKLLTAFGFKYTLEPTTTSHVPMLVNGLILFKGLVGIKRFIWMRTPGICSAEKEKLLKL